MSCSERSTKADLVFDVSDMRGPSELIDRQDNSVVVVEQYAASILLMIVQRL
jgi:hypothetical protein